jgi:hypothetical protein
MINSFIIYPITSIAKPENEVAKVTKYSALYNLIKRMFVKYEALFLLFKNAFCNCKKQNSI